MIDTSVAGVQMVVLVVAWSAGVGSVVVELTVAVFERSASRSGLTCTVMCTVTSEERSAGRHQRTVPAPWSQPMTAETKLVAVATEELIETLQAQVRSDHV